MDFSNHIDGIEEDAVQISHGVPGIALLFIKAYEVYGEIEYLNEAMEAQEVVWKRGLLRRGSVLSNGIAGNAYVFLALYRVTEDPMYLFRAMCFAEFGMEASQNLVFDETSSNYSLMQGITGQCWFHLDLMNPLNEWFPCVEFPRVTS
eukprot:TRINITY_DN20570_c0_g1_i1.p1 TRINITY_DN20570_c0_g1~~TRINITY_DN20570_c0_g1_i1.p1  ORF type:complete len:148 (+),score=1.50 TRINITY_DN20570_c0_g1_i1:459-902(+)